MSFSTPVLFLIFNRPETTSSVFEVIRAVKPKYLYVAADGPRSGKPDEEVLCLESRSVVVDGIDWECDVRTLFRSENLGCGKAVSSAINWFFEHVEEGIILEDDCLPNIDFFGFCSELLKKYKDHPEIMHVGGANFQPKRQVRQDSYYFSNYIHIWGWATWKRAWCLYSFNIPENVIDTFEQKLKLPFFYKDERAYWKTTFGQVARHEIDTWDIQWSYSLYQNSGIAVTPVVNLVSNIGFGPNATHTTYSDSKMANRPTSKLTVIIHPAIIRINQKFDRNTFKNLFQQGNTRFKKIKFHIGQKLPIVKQTYLKLKKMSN
ncbi:nucleotide-diphospho-sugar transferase [Mucilaginibacter aquaedulcis]|uniref:nucleotide-diphospho-sugar transferase n=1 Tax=Mucilaginibacter aquaedulcis TaxID=1187081 RepID=UPI0025B517E0|nr:nucleotide-diphospho-sugar transferase [Mucilaginibacter aquaedulcis]MDN3548727.1 nucleotide-diphospho-sugar transferase [Mucilaginibacter aquaedulcis]